MVKVGVIGGSGLEDPKFFERKEEKQVDTEYGEPSSNLIVGQVGEVEVVLLSRHGREHTIPPTQVNFRANIKALAEEGCSHILATTAVGSLREEIKRGDLVVLDQFIDFTRHRFFSFYEKFEPHIPKHTPMADPFDEKLRGLLVSGCKELSFSCHSKGTVVTIEGPRFSTRAESEMFRKWGADVINMSIAPEAALANEAGLPYAAMAMATDYDCWKKDEETVSWEAIVKVFGENVEKVTRLLVNVIQKLEKG